MTSIAQVLASPHDRLQNVIITFSIGKGDHQGSFRLVVVRNEPLMIEVVGRDRLGHDSWRPAKLSQEVLTQVLATAVLKSQMTPLQRIENPRMLHPDGVVWDSGDVTINLGKLTPLEVP